MIKLTWGFIRDREAMQSMGTLYAKPMGYDIGMKLALIGREMKKQTKLCNETHDSVLKKYGTADKEKPGMYKLHDATRNEYAAEMEKLDAHEFEINIPKIDARALSESVELSPQDLMLLEPLLLPLEEKAALANGKKTLAAVPPPSNHPAS